MPPPDGYLTAGREGGEVSISKLCNNKRWSLGPEWSMSDVVTSPPHNLDKPRGPVASNTHTHTHRYYLKAPSTLLNVSSNSVISGIATPFSLLILTRIILHFKTVLNFNHQKCSLIILLILKVKT